MYSSRSRSGFTLIELLTVIAIIAILMGLLFPAVRAAQLAAKKASAKNDITQLVTAVKSFYTDYGVYPVDTASVSAGNDVMYGDPTPQFHNCDLVNVLRADTTPGDTLKSGTNPLNINTRQVAYLDVPYCKDMTNPKSGLGNGKETGNSNGGKGGEWYDPFGGTYIVAIDADYDGYTLGYGVLTGYSDLTFGKEPTTGQPAVQTGCIAGCFGADHKIGTNGDAKFIGSDDVLSWQ